MAAPIAVSAISCSGILSILHLGGEKRFRRFTTRFRCGADGADLLTALNGLLRNFCITMPPHEDAVAVAVSRQASLLDTQSLQLSLACALMNR
jgi:hypothetical protein